MRTISKSKYLPKEITKPLTQPWQRKSNEDYHAHPSLSSTGFKDLLGGGRIVPMDSDSLALKLGSAVHNELEYYIRYGKDRRHRFDTDLSGAVTIAKAEHAYQTGKNYIDMYGDIQEEDTIVEGCILCRRSELTRMVLPKQHRLHRFHKLVLEVSDSAVFKAMPDVYLPDTKTLLDWKTTSCTTLQDIEFSIHKYGYITSQLYYMLILLAVGIEVESSVLVFLPYHKQEVIEPVEIKIIWDDWQKEIDLLIDNLIKTHRQTVSKPTGLYELKTSPRMFGLKKENDECEENVEQERH